MSLFSSPRTARSHASSFIQSIDVKTLHYQTSANVTFGLRWPRCGSLSGLCCLLLGDVARTCSRPGSASSAPMRRGGGTPGSVSSPPRPHELLTLLIHAVLWQRLTCTRSSASPCTTPTRGGASGGPRHTKVELITGHNPFVLLHVICLLSEQMTPIMRVNNEIRGLFMPRFFSSLIGRWWVS